MKSRNALRELATLSASQWGMITTAQAGARGVSRLDLARLAGSGDLVRLAHGVYRDAGAPADEYEDLRAAWLSTDPARSAEARLRDEPASVVVTGASAAWLHRAGELLADRHEFTTPVRRQSQRAEIRYRQRQLGPVDVTIVSGLPVTTLERTVADLVGSRTDLSLVADVLSDAARMSRLDLDRLAALLAPLSARNGLRRGDGEALLGRLVEIAGLDLASLAREIASSPQLGALVTAEYLERMRETDRPQLLGTPGSQQALREGGAASGVATSIPTRQMITLAQLARTTKPGERDFARAGRHSDD